MINNNFFESNKFLLIVSFISLILVFYLIFGFISLENKTIETQRDVEVLNSNIFNNRISKIKQVSKIISYNQDVLDFLNIKNINSGSSDIQYLIDVNKTLNNFRYIDDFIEEIYIYSNKSNYLVSFDNTFFDIESMYCKLIKFENLNFLQWKYNYLLNKNDNIFAPKVVARVKNNNIKVIPYIKKITRLGKYNNGILLFLINYEKIQELLKYPVENVNGFSLILDEENQVIASYNLGNTSIDKLLNTSKLRIDGKKYYINKIKFDKSNLTFIYATPVLQLIRPIQVIILLIIIALIIFIILILIKLILLSRKRSSYLKQLNSITNSKLEYKDLIPYIELVSNTEKVKETEFNKNLLFKRLIYNKEIVFQDINNVVNIDVETNVNLLKITLKDIKNKSFNNKILEDINFARINCYRLSKDLFSQKSFIYIDYDLNLWVLIPNENYKNIDKFYNKFLSLIPGKIIMIISNKYKFKDVKEATKECSKSELLIQNQSNSFGLHYYSEIAKRSGKLIFDRNTEINIINSIRDKNIELFNKEMDKIVINNFKNSNLSLESNIKLMEKLTQIAKIAYCNNSLKTFKTFYEVREFLNNIIEDDYLSKEDSFKNKILIEIEKNYSSYSFNLAKLSNILNVTENYLYHFIQTRFDKSFAKLLEDYRLKKAGELIENNSTLPINEIGSLCGYSNPQTFRRAFKKYYKILPSNYKSI